MAEESEDVVSKYKRLLNLARSNLEANQATLAQKDKQISQLTIALEEEKRNRSRKGGLKDADDSAIQPRTLLRRVDVDNTIWILVEYAGIDDEWLAFRNEFELDEFIQRLSGAPLTKPTQCLTPEESAMIQNESRKKLDAISEEFRRYKVRTDIARKQSMSPAPSSSYLLSASTSTPPAATVETESTYEQEISRWKSAYERAVKDNEQLKTRGGDALILAQWKERYETCLAEREELADKLKIYTRLSQPHLHDGSVMHGNNNNSNISITSSNSPLTSLHSSSGEGKSIEQMFLDLKDEYKEYRRRAISLEKQRVQELDELRALLGCQLNGGATTSDIPPQEGSITNNNNNTTSTLNSSNGRMPNAIGKSTTSLLAGSSAGANGLTENKIAYLRQMVVRYLSCRDPIVRPHIESALMAMLRVNAEEKSAIEERQRDDTQDPLTGVYGIANVGGLDFSTITNFLGSFTS